MNWTLKLEEIALLGLSVLAFQLTPYAWYWFLIWFLVPDLGMLGYLANPKVGAFTYNLCHHRGLATLLLVIGFWQESDITLFAGVILFGHCAFDRILGYGLKYEDNFRHTHLDWLNEPKS